MKSFFLKWTSFVPLLLLVFNNPVQAVTLKIATLSPDGSFWMQKFHGLDEVDYIRQKMDAELMVGLEQQGLVSQGFAEVGMAYIMSAESVQDLDQMRSRKAWAPEKNKLALVALKAFNKITKQDQDQAQAQATARSVMGRIIKEVDQQNRQDNLKAKEATIKLGIQFLKPTDQAAEELRKTIVIASDKLEKDGNLSADKVEKLYKYLADFRKLAP